MSTPKAKQTQKSSTTADKTAVSDQVVQKNKIWHRAGRAWKKSWLNRQLVKMHKKIEPTQPYQYAKGAFDWGYSLFKQMNDYKFFPKAMAARGGLTAMIMGGIMMAGLVVSSISAFTVAAGVTAIGMIVFGSYGLITYGGRLLSDGIRKFQEKVLKKDFNKVAAKAKPEAAPKKKKSRSPIKRLKNTGLWKNFEETAFMQRVKNSKGYKHFKNMEVWKHLNFIAKDQEVRLRVFATSGSIATILSAGTILAAQTVALPILTVSFATLLLVGAVSGVIGGTIAVITHAGHLVRSLNKAVKESVRLHRTEKALKKELSNIKDAPERAPTTETEDPKRICQDTFKKAASPAAKATNDNKAQSSSMALRDTTKEKTPDKKAPKAPTKKPASPKK